MRLPELGRRITGKRIKMINIDHSCHQKEITGRITKPDFISESAELIISRQYERELYKDKKARKMLNEMAEVVSETVSVYKETAAAMRDLSIGGETKVAKAKVAELIKQVNLKEHEADEVEAKAAAHVFSTGDDDALAAMHMYRVLQRMDDVANACEKAANAFLPSLSK